MTDKTLYILDGHALLYRAFYGTRSAKMNAPDGTPTGALFGFIQAIREVINKKKPYRFVATFDPKGKTFRKRQFAEYKANRRETPDELRVQLPLCFDACDAYGVPRLQVEDFEADDIIATLVRQALKRDYDVVIVSADKDLMQLVEPRVKMWDPKAGKVYDEKAVEDSKGLPPEKIGDWLALVGDSSDNIPGVSKVGPKTAVALLKKHGSLEAVLAAAAEKHSAYKAEMERYEKALSEWESIRAGGEKPGRKPKKPASLKTWEANLVTEADQARRSRELVTLVESVPLPLSIDDLTAPARDDDKLADLHNRTGIRILLDDMGAFVHPGETPEIDYRIVSTAAEFEEFMRRLRIVKRFAFDTETTGLNPFTDSLVGLSFSWESCRAWYLPLRAPELFARVLDTDTTLEALRPVLEDASIEKIGQNIKFDALFMRSSGVRLAGKYFDTMIADWLLDPGASGHDLDTLSLRYLGHRKIPTSELIGGKGATTMDGVPVEAVGEYACEDADVTFRLAGILEDRLREEGIDKLFFELEMPLVDVLEEMTWTGIKVNADRLKEMSGHFAAEIKRLEKDIHELAGQEFLVNSSAQLAGVLFDELHFPVIRKSSKTKRPSTDEEVLRQLMHHSKVPENLRKLPELVLEYRENQKLKSTYADALPKMINPDTGRIHTHFNQIGTATGRLSSSEPNLQNIPVRTPVGRRIRGAFITGEKGWKLAGFDYSQVELRVLAHVSGDNALKEAFIRGEDIHRAVAARLNGVREDEVTAEQRSAAKAVNFGIVYGQTDYGLAQSLGIPRHEAKAIIDGYFRAHPGVRSCIEDIIEKTRRDKFVTTLFDRRRLIPDIDAADHSRRKLMERIAVNTKIQGTAADLIKRAMLGIHDFLNSGATRARMLLQIHDELIFEVPEEELVALAAEVKSRMENAVELDVPLLVDYHYADTWEGLK